jgi:hypothetical protein
MNHLFETEATKHRNPEPEAASAISLDSAFVAIGCAALLYGLSWIMGCSNGPALKALGGKKLNDSRPVVRLAPDGPRAPSLSGRKLTIERMAQRAAISLQYSNEEYGVAFDAPKGYLLKEGELPGMDRGLGYLGPIPMHFAEPGGVRLATVEAPQGLHLGTNFVNDFFTVSAHYGSDESVCSDFDIPGESRGSPVTHTIDAIEFRGFQDRTAASMHQYSGIYLHAFANETCYEIGYGIATAGPSGSLKTISEEKQLQKLERILASVRINPPDFERNRSTD